MISSYDGYWNMTIEGDNRRQGADIQSKVQVLEELNQSLRNRDKMKDDAIAQLSDQLMASARMYEIERKQQL